MKVEMAMYVYSKKVVFQKTTIWMNLQNVILQV